MSDYELKIGLKGHHRIANKLLNVEKLASNPRPILDRWAVLGFRDVIDHFRKEEGPGGSWAALSQATLQMRRKGKKSRSDKILQDTGTLRNSLLPGSGLTRFEPTKVILSTRVEYGAKHEFGIGVPKRRFMWISDAAKERMEKVAASMLLQGM